MVNKINETENEFFMTKFIEVFSNKKHWTTVPTYSPANFFEQIVFYDDGANRRIYFYVNGSWSYTALT